MDLENKIEAYQSHTGNVCVAYHGTRCHPTCDFFVQDKVRSLVLPSGYHAIWLVMSLDVDMLFGSQDVAHA